jgi:hypothetical protein
MPASVGLEVAVGVLVAVALAVGAGVTVLVAVAVGEAVGLEVTVVLAVALGRGVLLAALVALAMGVAVMASTDVGLAVGAGTVAVAERSQARAVRAARDRAARARRTGGSGRRGIGEAVWTGARWVSNICGSRLYLQVVVPYCWGRAGPSARVRSSSGRRQQNCPKTAIARFTGRSY